MKKTILFIFSALFMLSISNSFAQISKTESSKNNTDNTSINTKASAPKNEGSNKIIFTPKSKTKQKSKKATVKKTSTGRACNHTKQNIKQKNTSSSSSKKAACSSKCGAKKAAACNPKSSTVKKSACSPKCGVKAAPSVKKGNTKSEKQ